MKAAAIQMVSSPALQDNLDSALVLLTISLRFRKPKG